LGRKSKAWREEREGLTESPFSGTFVERGGFFAMEALFRLQLLLKISIERANENLSLSLGVGPVVDGFEEGLVTSLEVWKAIVSFRSGEEVIHVSARA
jgi:hypothetical protein